MIKWDDIKESVLDELNITESEAIQNKYLEKMRRSFNKGLGIISNGLYEYIKEYTFTTTAEGDIVTMPDDFLSFTDYVDSFLLYTDAYGNTHTFMNPTGIIYIGVNKLRLGLIGTYTIYYRAYFGTLTKEDAEDITFDLSTLAPVNVLNCMPTYIASDLLVEDDPEKHILLYNQFEIAVSRLDNNIKTNNKYFMSEKGWY
ncbi:MAG: hypothetical protein RBR02_06370 [Desulfuromonadaceae bacterium]|nr:hypothetical protein [Desulfuromonadaceae bacterium]